MFEFEARQSFNKEEASVSQLEGGQESGKSTKESIIQGKYTHPDYQPPTSASAILRASGLGETAMDQESRMLKSSSLSMSPGVPYKMTSGSFFKQLRLNQNLETPLSISKVFKDWMRHSCTNTELIILEEDEAEESLLHTPKDKGKE